MTPQDAEVWPFSKMDGPLRYAFGLLTPVVVYAADDVELSRLGEMVALLGGVVRHRFERLSAISAEVPLWAVVTLARADVVSAVESVGVDTLCEVGG